MSLWDDIAAFVAAEIAKRVRVQTAVGTVVTSPSQTSTDVLTVTLDGSALAVPVKGLRGFPLFPGMRVGLVRFGTDWSVVGAFTNPGFTGAASSRLIVGADTPPELKAYGIDVAILSYITDKNTGLEIGYFWIGSSNKFDGAGDGRVQAFGNCTYPIPGDPSSATQSNVKTNFQQNMHAQYPQTIIKDHEMVFWTGISGESANSATGEISLRWDDEEIPRGPSGTIASGRVTAGATATTTVAGAEIAIPVVRWDAEANCTFKKNHIYAVLLRFAIRPTTNVVGSAQVRLRKGSASITGQILWSNAYNMSVGNTFEGKTETVLIKNLTGADITTKLSLTIARTSGTAEWAITGFPIGDPQLDVTLQDLGLENRNGHGHPWTGMAAAIV